MPTKTKTSKKIAVAIDEANDRDRHVLESFAAYIRQLAGLETLEFRSDVTASADTVKRVLGHAHVYVLLAGAVDPQVEIGKLTKELAGVTRELESLERKLGTAGFLERAPAELIGDTRARLGQLVERRQRLGAMLKDLNA